MEPLFVNSLAVDKAMLVEWYKQDFRKNHRLFGLLHIGLICLYLVMAAVLGWAGYSLRMSAMYIAAGVIVLLAVLFLLNLLLQHRLQVWLALRRDKGREFGKPFTLLFYPEMLLMVPGVPDSEEVKQICRFMTEMDTLRQAFAASMADMDKLELAREGQLVGLRQELLEMQQRMDALSETAKTLGRYIQHDYTGLTDCLQAPGLYALYFGNQAVLVRRDGFVQGDDAGFAAFLQRLTPRMEENRVRARQAAEEGKGAKEKKK